MGGGIFLCKKNVSEGQGVTPKRRAYLQWLGRPTTKARKGGKKEKRTFDAKMDRGGV